MGIKHNKNLECHSGKTVWLKEPFKINFSFNIYTKKMGIATK